MQLTGESHRRNSMSYNAVGASSGGGDLRWVPDSASCVVGSPLEQICTRRPLSLHSPIDRCGADAGQGDGTGRVYLHRGSELLWRPLFCKDVQKQIIGTEPSSVALSTTVATATLIAGFRVSSSLDTLALHFRTPCSTGGPGARVLPPGKKTARAEKPRS